VIHLIGHASTPDNLRINPSAACDLDVHVSYSDNNAGAVSFGRENTNLTASGVATVLAGPGAGITRKVKAVIIRNDHASSPVDVTVVHNAPTDIDVNLDKATLNAGEGFHYLEGVGWYTRQAAGSGFGDVIERVLDADLTGTDVTTAQPWFPTLGAFGLEAGVVYEMDMRLNLTRTAGAGSHTTSLLFGGTASLTYISWQAIVTSTELEANGNANTTSGRVATAVVVKTTSVATTEAFSLKVDGFLKVNAAGTVIPQFQYVGTAPGQAPTIRTGSHIRFVKRGAAYNTRGNVT